MNISDSQNQSQFDNHHYIGKLLAWHIQWRKKGKEEELPKLGTHENLSKSLYFHRSSQNSPLLFSFTQIYSLGHVLKPF